MNNDRQQTASFTAKEELTFAYALQFITPIPFLPGLPIVASGLIIFFSLLLFHRRSERTIAHLGRIVLTLALVLLAGWQNDVLLRLALCVLCLALHRLEPTPSFQWMATWLAVQILFSLVSPSQYLLRWSADGLSIAAWALSFSWVLPKAQFSFGPDLAHVPLLLLWLLYSLVHCITDRQAIRRFAVRFAVALGIVLIELNLLNASFSDFTIVLFTSIDAALFPLIFIRMKRETDLAAKSAETHATIAG